MPEIEFPALHKEALSPQELAEQEKHTRLLRNLYSDMRSLLQYMDDDEVTDIAVQHSGEIIISKFGQGRIFTGKSLSEITVHRIILSTAATVGTKVDPYTGLPKLEAYIPGYNARITGLLPPRVRRPVISIRKPAKKIYTLEEYVKNQQMTQEQYEFLVHHICERNNIVVSGQTGCGKTTLTNAIIKKMEEFTPYANFYIVEDVPELQCTARMQLPICTDKDCAAEAVEEALRFNPDRIIFGEVRSSKVMNALVTAWNTGHKGSVTTIHANTCLSTLQRIKKLLNHSGEVGNDRLSDVIQLVIHLSKTASGGIIVDEVMTVQEDTDSFVSLIEQNGLG